MKEIVSTEASRVNMPYVTERWPGGMLTNFATIRKSIKKMSSIDKMATDGTFAVISKKERLQISRERAKLEKLLGSIADLTRLPAALFIVDIAKEHIAISEAHKLNIPTFAIVDTNTDPTKVDFPIPGNDDATKSVGLIISLMTKAIEEGLSERKVEKEMDKEKEASVEKDGEVESRKLVAVEDEEDDKDGKKGPKAPAAGKPSARPRTNKAPTRR